MSIQRLKGILVVSLMAFALTGCGSGKGDVTIRSAALNGALARINPLALIGPDTGAAAVVTPTVFKFCVTKVKFENEDGEVEQKDGADEVEFAPGVIDMTQSAASALNWGTISNAPVGFKLSKLNVEVHKDAQLCPTMTNYSLMFDANTGAVNTSLDFEFKFRFNPPIQLDSGDAVSLSFATMVQKMADAAASGESALKAAAEGMEESGHED